jgi:hypothetical protein
MKKKLKNKKYKNVFKQKKISTVSISDNNLLLIFLVLT